MPISHIELIQLPTPDLGAAERFYATALGLNKGAERLPTQDAGGFLHFNYRRGPALQVVQPPSPLKPTPDGPVIGMELEPGTDLAALLRAAEAAGGRVAYRDIRTPDWLIVGLTDPAGNALELLIPH